MAHFSVVKSGNKQYLVKDGDTLVAERINSKNEKIELDVLMTFDDESGTVELGTPSLEKKAPGTIIENVKGEKIRVAKFKSKVRYRKVKGFRPHLTKIKMGE